MYTTLPTYLSARQKTLEAISYTVCFDSYQHCQAPIGTFLHERDSTASFILGNL